jgi:hypothetical protein
MSTAMERYEQPLALIQSIDDLARLSKQVADSEYYQGTSNAAQASVKLMIARELGLGITSISNIHLVKGKISLGYQILIALVKRSGKYDLRFVERSDERVVVDWFEDGEKVGQSKFDMQDAKNAGIGGDMYRKYPVRMLTARAISDGFNTFAPECAGGALYTPGELEDDYVAPRPIASARPQMASADTDPADTPEIVVDAELEESAPEPPRPAEDAVAPAPKQADSSGDPTSVLADLLKQMKPEHRRIVKSRTTLIGVKWDKETPAALVKHFGDDHDALMAHLSEPEVQVDVQPEGSEPTADTPEEFQQWVDQQVADEKQRQTQIAKAGAYGR